MDIDNDSPLLKIPIEVLLQIASYLTTPEYGNLRLTCRHTEAYLLKAFTLEFFTKRQFMISEFSLGALVDISKSRFASSLTHLIIGLERPPSLPSQQPVAAHMVSNVAQAHQYNKIRSESLSYQALVGSGRDVMLLAEALSNLPNLETIGLRDFCSTGRFRDAGDGDSLWHSYGAPTFIRETGCLLDLPRFSRNLISSFVETRVNHISHIFLTMLRALGETHHLHSPTRLEVILRACHLPNPAFNIPHHLESVIVPFLKGLKTLFLDLGQATFSTTMVRNQNSFRGYLGLPLVTFLSTTSSLEHLRLNFRGCGDEETRDILQWLSSTHDPSDGSISSSPTATQNGGAGPILSLPQVPPPPPFENLTQIDIGMLTIEWDRLLDIYKNYQPSLRIISLHKVIIKHSQQKQSADKVNLWARLFSQIASHKIKLSNVNLSYISQKPGLSTSLVEFRDSGYAANNAVTFTKLWTGNDFERAVGDIINSMSIQAQDTYDSSDNASP